MKCPFRRLDCTHYRKEGCKHRFYMDRHPDAPTCYQKDKTRAKYLDRKG